MSIEGNRHACQKWGILLLATLFIFVTANTLSGGSIKFIKKLEFSPQVQSPESPGKPELPLNPWSFCVTDDELFMIPDYPAGNVKIYEVNGEYLELIKTIGRKGYFGPKALAKPAYCFYSNDEYKFGVVDLGIRKIFIYDRIGRTQFKRVQEVFCPHGATDLQLINNKLFISGYTTSPDGGDYDFYYVDLADEQPTVLLPSYHKFGFKSFDDHKKKYSKNHIPAIGIFGWADISNDNAYFVWEGNLKIIKLNVVTGEVAPKTFGYQPPDYIKPYASKALVKGLHTQDKYIVESERARMSYVVKIFATAAHLLVIYKGPVNQFNQSNYRLQFYTFDGDFIEEAAIPGQPGHRMWFDKDKKILYSLSNEPNESSSGITHFILEYEIQE